MTGPTRVNEFIPLQPGESYDAWFKRTFGWTPTPTAESIVASTPTTSPRLRRARAALERSIPSAYAWATLDAPELPERVYGPAIAVAETVCHEPRVCLVGPSRTGKTSLAVAMLRAWVAKHERSAMFVAAHRLGMARIQHPAGHGEAELVEAAMRAPLVLLDDLGSDREFGMNPIDDIVFERHAYDRATWITTGLRREPLLARYGAGVVARLFERARVISLGPRDSFEKSDATRK